MLPKSKYLEFFTLNRETLTESMHLIGDIILIEKLKAPEAKTASGIVLVDYSQKQMGSIGSDRPNFFRVLLPGAGYYDDSTKEAVSIEANPGDIILVGTVSAKMFSSFPLLESYEPDTIGITREADIQIRFKGEESFGRFVRDFDAHIKAQVESARS